MDASLIAAVLGQVTAFCLFYSATPGMVKDRQRGSLTTDPVPFPVALLSNLLWILYATLIEDPWILLGNFVGLGATTFNTLTVLKLCQDEKTMRTLELVLGCGIFFVGAMISTTTNSMFLTDPDLRRSISGNVCIAIYLVMCASPTLGALKALRSGDASAVSLPLAAAQLINGLLWGFYGMVLGDVVVMGPNLMGGLLALLNVVAKVRGLFSQPAGSAVELKQIELLSGNGEIRMRSLHHSRYVHVGDESSDSSAVEQGSAQVSELSVSQEDEGTTLQVLALSGEDASEKRFALRTQDGRFLSVCPRPAGLRASAVNPSPLRVVAMQRGEPGPEGEFVAVVAPAQDVDHYVTTGRRGMHRYPEESVGFWNPLHKVFVRVNEFGALDCSPEFNAQPSLGLLMPAGWEWERFTVHAAPPSPRKDSLRLRASTVGKAAIALAA